MTDTYPMLDPIDRIINDWKTTMDAADYMRWPYGSDACDLRNMCERAIIALERMKFAKENGYTRD